MFKRDDRYSVHVKGRSWIEYKDGERTVRLRAGMLDQEVYVYRHLNVTRDMGLRFLNPDGSQWRPPT
jgi:hypothetical protein